MCDYLSSTNHEQCVVVRRAHRDSSRIINARVCALSLRMFLMHTDSRRRAAPEKVVQGGESCVESERERGSTWAKVRELRLSTSSPISIVPLTHASSSPRDTFARANGQGSPVSGLGIRRSRYRRAHRPLDRRLCVATFRWFCLCQKSRGAEDTITMSTSRRDGSLTVVERAARESGKTLF
jgi:hypothetical protein